MNATKYVLHHTSEESCLYTTSEHGRRVMITIGPDSGDVGMLREANETEIAGGILVAREQRITTYQSDKDGSRSELTYHAWVDIYGHEIDYLMRPRTGLATDQTI